MCHVQHGCFLYKQGYIAPVQTSQSFVIGYWLYTGQKVKGIFAYDCSTINLMPKSIMNDLGITVEELSKSQMMVQGFNIEGQCAIDMICLELAMGNLSTTSTLHVIDSNTS